MPQMLPTLPTPPTWQHAPAALTEGFSLEMTARDIDALRAAAAHIPAGTSIAITFLPGEDAEDRIAAARAVRELGFEPMPHFSARRLASVAEFEGTLARMVNEADVRRCFVVAGDAAEAGPFADTSALIATGAFERNGTEIIGLAGHPEGHPHMSEQQCWDVLADKCAMVAARGMRPLIVTQFGFDARPFVTWITDLRRRGIDAPVRIGVPGPAGIRTLMRFAARCGVGASASVMAKYGISLGRLMGSAGPDRLVEELAAMLGPELGDVRLHFYPFGGLGKTVEWIAGFNRQA
ncbi:methylenetetrahydrofolate reductase [Novosphingobium resinovorum]|uniref:methylenetetrahydrofolate reductase n=1 Tax=Novosphingobium resinovorum TaxID=158500 RepID=UPI002ED52666|nr:methylenetetrahydrofolate reductase [Novosphingobium resinovorum]